MLFLILAIKDIPILEPLKIELMNLLPFENITYETRLSLIEIQSRISDIIEPKKTFRKPAIFRSVDTKPYEGRLVGNTFKVTRLIRYQNSFLPKIKGEIEKGYRGTKVNIKMRLHPFVLVFMLIWFGGVIMAAVSMLAASVTEGFDGIALIPVGMLVFGYALVTGAFKYETQKSKKFFAELFEAKVV